MWSAKDIYYISDSTALLTEDMGKSLLCQFPEIHFNEEKIPFVKTKGDAEKALAHIRIHSGAVRPLVFCTIMDEKIRYHFDVAEVEFFDLYGGFLDRLEYALEAKALREPGYFRHRDTAKLDERIAAIHFSIEHDDGTKSKEYDKADIILVGVSRSGKTPVSVYLASHMGIKTANFPLTSDHLNQYGLPDDIVRNRKRVIGLTTSANYLHKVREKRYTGSKYANLATCNEELQLAEQLFIKHGIQTVNTEGCSIEELAVKVLQLFGISRKQKQQV